MIEPIAGAAHEAALQIWLSPAFPVGSFAYSHGIEAAVEAGHITDRATAEAWLADLLLHGGPRNDAIVLAAAWRATTVDAADFLAEANDLALALSGSRERHLETVAQGNAFLSTIRAAWPHPRLAAIAAAITGDVAYPVAVGLAAAAHGIALPATTRAFVTAFIANLTSALVRLGTIGQTDAQRILAGLLPLAVGKATEACQSDLDDIGGAAFSSDLAAIAHETLHSRLFRS